MIPGPLETSLKLKKIKIKKKKGFLVVFPLRSRDEKKKKKSWRNITVKSSVK